jgi:hypothetical protein
MLRSVSIWSLNETLYLQTSQFEALISSFLTTGRYIFRNMLSDWMMSLSDQSPEVVRLISSPVLPKWLQPIMFAEQHGSVSKNPLDDGLKVTFDGICPLIYEPNNVLFATRIPTDVPSQSIGRRRKNISTLTCTVLYT